MAAKIMNKTEIIRKDLIFELYRETKREGSNPEDQNITYCIAVIEEPERGVRKMFHDRNRYGNHAEDRVLGQIKEFLQQEERNNVSLTMYINYSPDNDCADLLVDFQKKYNSNISIKAVAPYERNSNRAMCLLMNHEHIILEAFKADDWKVLHRLIENLVEVPGRLTDCWKPLTKTKARDARTAERFVQYKTENLSQRSLLDMVQVKKRKHEGK